QHLPSNFTKIFIAFQQYVIGLHKGHDYLLSQMGNADETPVSFDEPSSNIIEEIGTKSVIIKTLGNEKMCITVMLAALADGIKLPPYVILKRKTMLQDQMPTGIIVRCQNQGWMSTDLMKDWLNIVWNRRPGVPVCKRRMLVLGTVKGYLTPAMKNILEEMNAAIAVVPGGMS
ncbi:Pogo transposable element with KRAB domain, partial [Calypte anna]